MKAQLTGKVISVTVILILNILLIAPLRAASVVVVDAQAITLGEREILLRFRSSGPQPFDVVESSDPLTTKVRLHNAVLKELKGLDNNPEFGSVTAKQQADDKVLIEINCRIAGYKVYVSQGDSVNSVEIRVAWAPDTDPPVLSDIQASDVTSNSARISWHTDEPATSQLIIGLTQEETYATDLQENLDTAHEIFLSDLKPKATYYYAVKSKDAQDNIAVSNFLIFTTLAPAFREIDGKVTIEAENSDARIMRSGKNWVNQTSQSGFSGSGYVAALANTGALFDQAFTGISPEISYTIRFTKTGTYYVWIRGRANNGNDDSLHAGIDGAAPQSSDRITGFGTAWKWSRVTQDNNAPAAFNVLTPGLHTFHLWMREDGFMADKIYLTSTNSATPPSGNGPAESSRN